MTDTTINPIAFNLTRAMYKRRETADVLSISLSTLDRLVKDGKIEPPVKVGSECRFYATGIARFMAGLRGAAA
jgi:excisionase family DNA binding protein